MIHIVFQEPDVAILSQAIQMDESLSGPVMLIRDDYAVGPLKDIYSPSGIENRKQWWRDVLAGGDLDGKVDDGSVDDAAVVEALKQAIDGNPDEVAWIWAAQNKHDVSGYYWLMSQLKEYQGRIYILYLNNLPFFSEKGNIFYPDRLGVIPPKEFLKAKKLARPITASEFEVDPDEWQKITEQEKDVRLLEGGKKLSQHDTSFYDPELKKFITHDWQKAGKIISSFLAKGKNTTGDAYLLWRLKQMTTDEDIEVQGQLKGAKDFELKLAGANLQPQA